MIENKYTKDIKKLLFTYDISEPDLCYLMRDTSILRYLRKPMPKKVYKNCRNVISKFIEDNPNRHIRYHRGYKYPNLNWKKVCDYSQKYSIPQAQEKFGLSKPEIGYLRRKHGYHKSKITHNPKLDEDIIRYSQVHTLGETSRHFKVSLGTISNLRAEYGVHKSPTNTFTSEANKIVKFYLHHTMTSTTAKFGCGATTVSNMMEKRGLHKNPRPKNNSDTKLLKQNKRLAKELQVYKNRFRKLKEALV